MQNVLATAQLLNERFPGDFQERLMSSRDKTLRVPALHVSSLTLQIPSVRSRSKAAYMLMKTTDQG